MKYKILTSKDTNFSEAKRHLEEQVINHLSQEWRFVGGVSTSYDDIAHIHYFAQALARKE